MTPNNIASRRRKAGMMPNPWGGSYPLGRVGSTMQAPPLERVCYDAVTSRLVAPGNAALHGVEVMIVALQPTPNGSIATVTTQGRSMNVPLCPSVA